LEASWTKVGELIAAALAAARARCDDARGGGGDGGAWRAARAVPSVGVSARRSRRPTAACVSDDVAGDPGDRFPAFELLGVDVMLDDAGARPWLTGKPVLTRPDGTSSSELNGQHMQSAPIKQYWLSRADATGR
jgi:hypothetical protein